MRKWKRIDGADGPRFRSSLAQHEAALLRNLVTSLTGMLDDRESAAPADELSEITGIRTGHSAPPEDETLKRLTDQERRILALIAEGKTNRQIGEEMFLAEKTVKNYVSSLLAKLGMERRTQAAVFAARILRP